ncbi:MAG: helix-turn-helix transcriptional regulator [Fuerstiella sp.]
MSPARKEPDLSTYSGRLAGHLRQLREASGLTSSEAAEKMNKAGYVISEAAFRHWENGTRSPHWDALPALAKTLKVKVRELVPEK